MAPPSAPTSRDGAAFDRGIARGIAGFRVAALAWAWIGLVLERGHLTHRFWAIAGLALASAVTVATTTRATRQPDRAFAPAVLIAELAVGTGLLLLDGLVYEPARQQSLPWSWPAAAVIAVGAASGAIAGLSAAALVAAASFVGESLLRDRVEWTVSAASKSALYALAAVVAATVATRLREAEREISTARAREEVARTLHDGVLQTLAAVQRRTTDDELRALARTQERDLRTYLFGREPSRGDLRTALREVGDLVARRDNFDVQFALADDLPPLAPTAVRALAGAVQEALTNAAKHSGAARAVLYAEPADDDGVFCSVRDDGVGFDRTAIEERGLRHSIRGRLADHGGRVEIDSRAGRGTEVRMWMR